MLLPRQFVKKNTVVAPGDGQKGLGRLRKVRVFIPSGRDEITVHRVTKGQQSQAGNGNEPRLRPPRGLEQLGQLALSNKRLPLAARPVKDLAEFALQSG